MTELDLMRDLGEAGATIAAGSEGARTRPRTGGRRGVKKATSKGLWQERAKLIVVLLGWLAGIP